MDSCVLKLVKVSSHQDFEYASDEIFQCFAQRIVIRFLGLVFSYLTFGSNK